MAFVLKEAFRYQNYLESLITSADRYLRDTNNVMKITEKHLRSKVQTEAEDETKTNVADRALNVTPDKLIEFVTLVYKEKALLSQAINEAKIQHCSDMDMSMALNKTRQRIVETFKRVAALKNRKVTSKGVAYCFNGEGNQVEYYYDLEIVSEADFDRLKLKKIIKDMSSESDVISTRIDYYLSSVPVNYEPAFDINETFEELVENFDKVIK